METHKALLENKRLAKQTKKYEKMGDVFHQLSSDSDVSFSGADDVEKDPNYSDVIPQLLRNLLQVVIVLYILKRTINQ